MNKDIFLPPLLLFFFLIFIWEVSLYFNNTPHYIVPRPSLIIITLFNEWKSLFPALLTTLSVTFLALFLAIFIGITMIDTNQRTTLYDIRGKLVNEQTPIENFKKTNIDHNSDHNSDH